MTANSSSAKLRLAIAGILVSGTQLLAIAPAAAADEPQATAASSKSSSPHAGAKRACRTCRSRSPR